MGSDPGARGSSGSLTGELEGRAFLSTAVAGRVLVQGSRIRLDFGARGRLRAHAGCNHLAGELRCDGQRLTVEALSMTEMSCGPALDDQDSWLQDLLQSGLDAELDGYVLTLTGRGVRLELLDRRVADPNRPLERTAWMLDGLIIGTGPTRALTSTPFEVTAWLALEHGRMRFFDGAHDYDSAVTVGSDAVHLHGEVTRRTAGDMSAHSVDLSVLTRDFRYLITGRYLTVTGAGGAGLMFVAIDTASVSVTSTGI
ncbi:META domain-containing protein [Flexivirga caeni]|uniref:META domain-containing protein n=1 Tax=Flexivirga caeni TaxID=2294115 RepID=A0A3M9M7R3_9MICO|nr:META domain-containing protein [Flexivirga caeni]RNI21610.1 META domain-containing protein [Flexivirga caeni]